MKKAVLIWMLMVLASPAFAQSLFELVETGSGKLIYMPRRQPLEFKLQIPEAVFSSYTPSSTATIDAKLREFIPSFTPTSIDERPMDMQVLSAAYRPFYNPYALMLQSVNPMAFDFQETSVVPLSQQLAFFTTGRQFTWPGAGGITDIRSGLAWQVDKLTVAGSAFAGRFYTPFNASPGYMGGVQLDAHYQLTDWLGVRSWGQYTAYNGRERFNPHMLMNTNYNHTGVGGAFEFYFNDNWGVGMGVQYEFNPWKHKLEPQFFAYPIYRSSR